MWGRSAHCLAGSTALVRLGGLGNVGVTLAIVLAVALYPIVRFGWNADSTTTRAAARTVVILTVVAVVAIVPLAWWYFSNFDLVG